jgi:hypothetical protein
MSCEGLEVCGDFSLAEGTSFHSRYGPSVTKDILLEALGPLTITGEELNGAGDTWVVRSQGHVFTLYDHKGFNRLDPPWPQWNIGCGFPKSACRCDDFQRALFAVVINLLCNNRAGTIVLDRQERRFVVESRKGLRGRDLRAEAVRCFSLHGQNVLLKTHNTSKDIQDDELLEFERNLRVYVVVSGECATPSFRFQPFERNSRCRMLIDMRTVACPWGRWKPMRNIHRLVPDSIHFQIMTVLLMYYHSSEGFGTLDLNVVINCICPLIVTKDAPR